MKSKQLNVKCERVLVDIPDSDLYVSWNLFLNTLAGVFLHLTVPYICCVSLDSLSLMYYCVINLITNF